MCGSRDHEGTEQLCLQATSKINEQQSIQIVHAASIIGKTSPGSRPSTQTPPGKDRLSSKTTSSSALETTVEKGIDNEADKNFSMRLVRASKRKVSEEHNIDDQPRKVDQLDSASTTGVSAYIDKSQIQDSDIIMGQGVSDRLGKIIRQGHWLERYVGKTKEQKNRTCILFIDSLSEKDEQGKDKVRLLDPVTGKKNSGMYVHLVNDVNDSDVQRRIKRTVKQAFENFEKPAAAVAEPFAQDVTAVEDASPSLAGPPELDVGDSTAMTESSAKVSTNVSKPVRRQVATGTTVVLLVWLLRRSHPRH